MWPYRLVTSIYSLLISRFPSSFSIETTTVAESVRSSGHQTQPFRVHTSRGEIAAEHVIHATDSFASNLIPGLTGKLFPVRGHMSAQRPGTAFPKLNGSRSWSLIGQKGFEYITQRPDSADDPLANALMAGGGVVQSENRGLDELGIWRDDQTSTPIRAYLDGILPVAFGPENWGDDQCPSRLIQLWTGCMGFTLDLLPYVGHLDARLTHRPVPKPTSSSSSETEGILSSPAPAEWISAGFNGEGMVSAWLSGVAVALMVLGREDVPNTTNACGRPAGRMDTWFPEELRCSKRRLDSASIYDFARWI
jgi:glycine/D-amino acid oxidase-like deaminating enzyme